MAFDLEGLDAPGASLVAKSGLSDFDWSFLKNMQDASQASGTRALFTSGISQGQTVDDIANTAGQIAEDDSGSTGNDAYQQSKAIHDQTMNGAMGLQGVGTFGMPNVSTPPVATMPDNSIPGSTMNADGSYGLPPIPQPNDGSPVIYGGPSVPIDANGNPVVDTTPYTNAYKAQHDNIVDAIKKLGQMPAGSPEAQTLQNHIQWLYNNPPQIPQMGHSQPDNMGNLLALLTNVFAPSRFSSNIAMAPQLGADQRDRQAFADALQNYNLENQQHSQALQGASQALGYQQQQDALARQNWAQQRQDLQNQLAMLDKQQAESHKEYLQGLQHFSDKNLENASNNTYGADQETAFKNQVTQWALDHGEDPNQAWNIVQHPALDSEGDNEPDAKERHEAWIEMNSGLRRIDAEAQRAGGVTADIQQHYQDYLDKNKKLIDKYGFQFSIPAVGEDWHKVAAERQFGFNMDKVQQGILDKQFARDNSTWQTEDKRLDDASKIAYKAYADADARVAKAQDKVQEVMKNNTLGKYKESGQYQTALTNAVEAEKQAEAYRDSDQILGAYQKAYGAYQDHLGKKPDPSKYVHNFKAMGAPTNDGDGNDDEGEGDNDSGMTGQIGGKASFTDNGATLPPAQPFVPGVRTPQKATVPPPPGMTAPTKPGAVPPPPVTKSTAKGGTVNGITYRANKNK